MAEHEMARFTTTMSPPFLMLRIGVSSRLCITFKHRCTVRPAYFFRDPHIHLRYISRPPPRALLRPLSPSMPMSTLKYPIMKIPGFAFEDTVLSTCATHSQWLMNPTLPAYAWVHAIDSRSGVSTFSASLARHSPPRYPSLVSYIP